MRSAIEPLVSGFAVELFDDGSVLRSPVEAPAQSVAESEFGNSAEGDKTPRLQREQLPASELPAALRLSYYELARDFQAGEARASAGEQQSREEEQGLPAVLDAGAAKSLCQQILARRWAERDRLTLRLPPRYLTLEPGSKLMLPLTPAIWTLEQCEVDGFVVVAKLRPSWKPAIAITGDGGRIVPNVQPDIGDVTLALFDVPQLFDQSSTQPTLILAASSPAPGWKNSGVEVVAGSQVSITRTAAQKTVLGRALTVLPAGDPYLIDEAAKVDVELIDADQWLVSCDDEALVSGTNLAILGSELIQFGEAMPIGPGQFRLSRLLRGRVGTEWAAGIHASGDCFALMGADSVRPVELPDWVTGSQVTAAVLGTATGSNGATITATGESLRPPSPVRLEASVANSGDLALKWIRRSRRGWAWIDGIDAPLGESRENYRVMVSGPLGSIELDAAMPELTIAASEFAAVGSGEIIIEVRQIGDWASSRAVQLTITIG